MQLTLLPLTLLTILIAAQAPPGAPNLPACGTTVVLPAIEASKCGFTDPKCLCANANFKTAITTTLGTKCSNAGDKKAYETFVNGQCSGQPGFPVVIS